MSHQHGAHVEVVHASDEHDVVRGDEDTHGDEDRRARDARSPNAAQRLEADGQVDGDVPLDGECEDEAGGVIAEQVHRVLQ